MKKKRIRWPDADLDQLDRQIVELVREDAPVSVRNIFYRMTDSRLPICVPKEEGQGYERIMGRVIKLRRSGRIDYEAISQWDTMMRSRGEAIGYGTRPAQTPRRPMRGLQTQRGKYAMKEKMKNQCTLERQGEKFIVEALGAR